ncbi:pyridoxal phosphate-dependent decarboxylase family protein [Sphingosinicella rhizophila]|uniref:Aminotransferase class V-fold PLP-dependent enzyme n=1 Tax=Sphingosinicella rhizophila TaxID=3050082 RepID=A0ABU3Q510_9SPHN|nr:aminotransferase class V-fold PLP-dependent enzyme [Sphingosinicella sp. GR2756]MDT9598501.1 aminotransferase class V-fold PLP-dependent enzyme [Sphingosinicella sp. GR2756]
MIEELKLQIDGHRKAMQPLEPDADTRAALGRQALDHALAYLDALPDAPSNGPWADVFSRHLEPEFPEEGHDFAPVLDYLATCVEGPGFTTASPRFMAYIPGGGLFHSALGDLLAAASNKFAGFASAAPGAVRLENATIEWLAKAIGYPESTLGILTSGGSIANLTAVVAARDARDDAGGGAVYTTRFAHHCVDKALHVAGRGKAPRRLIATDESFRMSIASLEEALAQDREAGIRPWLVVASAGTVDTGSVDPLFEIAQICRRYGAWFHIDGAYGGLFALCEDGRQVLRGIELSDSVALDPHKTLFLPYGTGAVLVREGRHLVDTFGASPNYMQPLGESEVGPSPSDLSPELTRHFRALRLWLPLQLAGASAFRAAQAEKLALARYFHARLTQIPDFDPGPPPDLSVITFRYQPRGGDTDAFNERLLRRTQEEGRVMLSGTRIDGRFMIRCAILNFRTHIEHVDEAIDVLGRGIAELEGPAGS